MNSRDNCKTPCSLRLRSENGSKPCPEPAGPLSLSKGRWVMVQSFPIASNIKIKNGQYQRIIQLDPNAMDLLCERI